MIVLSVVEPPDEPVEQLGAFLGVEAAGEHGGERRARSPAAPPRLARLDLVDALVCPDAVLTEEVRQGMLGM